MLWDLETNSFKEADYLAQRSPDSWGTRSHSSKRRGQDQRGNGGGYGFTQVCICGVAIGSWILRVE